MKPYSVKMYPELWNAAKIKAHPISLSLVIRRLIEMWLNGEIKVDFFDNDNPT